MRVSIKDLTLKLYTNPIMKNIRIFYLILIIIAVMLIFLGFQGYLSLTNINNLQQANQEMFNTSIRFEKETYDFKGNLLYLKENYLKRLSNLSDLSAITYTVSDISSNLAVIQSLSSKTANINTEALKAIIAAIPDVQKLAIAPDTKENFLEFQTKLDEVIGNLATIQVTTSNALYEMTSLSAINARKQKTIIVIFLIASGLIAVVIGFFINGSVSWPLREIINSARLMAAGDFTQNIHSFGCKETYEVVQELNTSINSLRLLIGNINKESERVAEASEELKTAAKESGKSAEEVARAMEELARAATSQADHLSQTVENVNILGEKVRKVSQETLNIASTSEEVAKSAQNGQIVTSNVANEINHLYESTKAIGVVINDLNEATKEIGEITAEIREIADQTTLLTLNASIEAARAGEHGKGFSIVANATGKLGERVRIAAETIAEHTVQMHQKVEHGVQIMEQGILRVEEGKNLAGQATITFEGIFNELRTVLARIEEMAKSAKEMGEHNEEVISAVSNIAAISEESMASTQEVSATAEEQMAAAQEVTAYAENLRVISNEIKQSAGVFKI